jgi:hypothetical protein
MYHVHAVWVTVSSIVSLIESNQYPFKVKLNFGNKNNFAGEISSMCGTAVVVQKVAMYQPRIWLLFCTAA